MHEKITRRNLPHWDLPGAIYFVTTCLEGSIPAQGLLDLARHREAMSLQSKPAQLTEASWKQHQWKLGFVEREKWLDRSPASQHLADHRLANIVQSALLHFDRVRYDLIAWVIMPSHYHWVFRPCESWVQSLGDTADMRSPRERIQHSVNRYTALECNRLLQQRGSFWQHESYDHCIRDEGELERIVNYIHANPVKAGLVMQAEAYVFSSLHCQHQPRISF